MTRAVLAFLFGLAACSASEPELGVDLSDPVVEARVRSLLIEVLEGPSCPQIWAVPPAEVRGLGRLVQTKASSFPVNPSFVLEGLSASSTARLHVVARDADERVVARGCDALMSAEAAGRIGLRALPDCDTLPSALDLAVVFDASSRMQAVNALFGGVARIFAESFIRSADFASGSELSLVAFGSGPVRVVVDRAREAERVADGVLALEAGPYGGPADLFGAMVEGVRGLRERAHCGQLPALVVLTAGTLDAESGSRVLPIEAAFALYAAEADRTDDIFAFGVALTESAQAGLSLAIPEDVGEVQGAQSASALERSLRAASFAVRSRLTTR